jgi:outer membrane lipoprotein SlyB
MAKKFIIPFLAAATAVTAMPSAAQAQYRDGYYGRTYRDYNEDRRYDRRCSGTTGTIVGGAGGALLGRQVAGRGNGTIGTILGGAAGALLGREVGKSTCRNSSRRYRY